MYLHTVHMDVIVHEIKILNVYYKLIQIKSSWNVGNYIHLFTLKINSYHRFGGRIITL